MNLPRLIALWLLCLLAFYRPIAADDVPPASTDTPAADEGAFQQAVRTLVLKHYPDAAITNEDGTLKFSFNTRKFMIHTQWLTGGWQDASEEIGPQSRSRGANDKTSNSGIVGTISVVQGPYAGMASLPQTFDRHYFKTLVMAPFSEPHNIHLSVNLKYPADAPAEFLKEFRTLMNNFAEYVPAPGK